MVQTINVLFARNRDQSLTNKRFSIIAPIYHVIASEATPINRFLRRSIPQNDNLYSNLKFQNELIISYFSWTQKSLRKGLEFITQ